MASTNRSTPFKVRDENSINTTRSGTKNVNGESSSKKDGAATKPKQTIRLILGPKPSPAVLAAEEANRRYFERANNRTPSLGLSVAKTREVTRNVQAKGKDTLMRRTFHNPDGSLRGVGEKEDVTSHTPTQTKAQRPAPVKVKRPAQVQVTAQTQRPQEFRVFKDLQNTIQAENSYGTETRPQLSAPASIIQPDFNHPPEAGSSKNDDWCRKAKGGVTRENAVEVFGNATPLVYCGGYPSIVEAHRNSEAGKKKLPPSFRYETSLSKSTSASTANTRSTNLNSGSAAQSGVTRENAIEVFDNGPQSSGQRLHSTGLMIDPELQALDDERAGRCPPIEDKIWFMQSPFRVRRSPAQLGKTTY